LFVISFTIAYQVNIRKLRFMVWKRLFRKGRATSFTSNTSLVFNWGTSDQVQTISTTIRSRSHNELVVDKLQYYIDYLVQGKYNMEDAYGLFLLCELINQNRKSQQIGDYLLSETEYEITMPFENNSVSN
jgi:hypothetical protein